MFEAQDVLTRRLLEADLISGALELSDLAHDGIPEGRRKNFLEPPQVILQRLLDAVEPSDLTPAAGVLWTRARIVWAKQGRLSWQWLETGAEQSVRDTAAFIRSHGLGIGLHAPGAASRLLRLSQATHTFRRANEEATAALDEARAAVRGV